LASGPFHIGSLLSAAELLGKDTTLDLSSTDTESLLATSEDTQLLTRVLTTARKLVGKSGVCSVFRLEDELLARGLEIGEDVLRGILTNVPDTCHFLAEDWFVIEGIPPTRDRLRNTLRKMLSVAAPQDISTLREGVRRAFRGRSIANSFALLLVPPPSNVLRAYVQLSPEFDLTGDTVVPTALLDYRTELGENEQVLVDVLRSSPAGVLDRRSLAAACIARGMNENTFGVYSSYSCILEHLDLDVWKLRGITVDPGSVEALRRANRLRPRAKRVLGHEWTDEGKLRLTFRILYRSAGDTAVFGCPTEVRRYLAGAEFNCTAGETGQPCGKVAMDERGTLYGFLTYVQRLGLDDNDVLVAEFDINERTVVLRTGSDEVLDAVY